MIDNTDKYEQLLRQFDIDLAKEIRSDVLSACFDNLFNQGYVEGYNAAQAEIKKIEGRDSEASDYAALSILSGDHFASAAAECMLRGRHSPEALYEAAKEMLDLGDAK